jgi:ankyrin repeat protein
MLRIAVTLWLLLASAYLVAFEGKRVSYNYEVARAHEIEPHRRTIPLQGSGSHQLHLILSVSATGDVINAKASGNQEALKFWPQIEGEVNLWKFTPFEENGKTVTADVEEYVGLVPAERLPKTHVAPPILRPNSQISVSLTRSVCFGSCPSYTVMVSPSGILFEGSGYVVAYGKHTDKVDISELRSLAQRFVAADFYSMESSYAAGVTDSPTYTLAITIDGREKKVEDCVGSWVGMPAVITDLEDAVDMLARTDRWIEGSDGLVEALQGENFNFESFEAQRMLKEASIRGQAQTVRALLGTGVPLEPLPGPKLKERYMTFRLEHVGWLSAAASHPEALQALLSVGASKNDQKDKDFALARAAGAGSVDAVEALIAYGADPNADLSQLTVTQESGGMSLEGEGSGVLIYAAKSGNPEMVREILHYHPNLEIRDHRGKTALFAAGEHRHNDKDGARVECVRLLVQAGADVNARDNKGNTPLHETYLTDVEEELLKLGADVNARNSNGETPIFTTLDNGAVPLFIAHGADLTVRNNKGQTVIEAAKDKGPLRQESLRKALEKLNER